MISARPPWWTWTWPAFAWVILLMTAFLGGGGIIAALAGVALFGTVFAAVYHAEVVAHRVGEPFGTLVLALAVTVIETALIVSVMIAAPAEKAGLARDTVFAAVMIVCNGIVGSCLLIGRCPSSRTGISGPRSERRAGRAGRAHQPRSDSSKLCGKRNSARCTARRSSSLPGLYRWCSTARSFSSRPCGTATTSSRSKRDDEEAHAPPPSDKTAVLSAGLFSSRSSPLWALPRFSLPRWNSE